MRRRRVRGQLPRLCTRPLPRPRLRHGAPGLVGAAAALVEPSAGGHFTGLATAAAEPAGRVLLCGDRGLGGTSVAISGPVPDLERLNFNDCAASIVILAGTWEVCTDARFAGSCAVFRPCRYPRLGGLTRQVSSLRRIQ